MMTSRSIDGPFTVKTSLNPPSSQWRPEGLRLANLEELTSDVLPQRDRFTTLHSNIRNDEEVSIAFAPVFGLDFVVEERAYLSENPTLLSDGTILFIPTAPLKTPTSTTNHFVIALDGTTGQRLWTLEPAQLGQGGSPLVLRDPNNQGENVYLCSIETLTAMDGSNGAVLWQTETTIEYIPGDRCYGASYHSPTDTILILTQSGMIQAYNRSTGELLAVLDFPERFGSVQQLVPPIPEDSSVLFESLDALASEYFDIDLSLGGFEKLLLILSGEGVIVANYFSVFPDTGSIYAVATLSDGHNGDEAPGDGFSEAVALFHLNLESDGNGGLQFAAVCVSDPMRGGSGATPAVSADGQRIYTADSAENIVVYNPQCERVYTVSVGSDILGSLTVASSNREVYVQSRTGPLKIIENEDRTNGEIPDAFRRRTSKSLQSAFGRDLIEIFERLLGGRGPLEARNVNLISLGANGLMTVAAYGLVSESFFLPLSYAMVMLDRETGQLINVAQMREETIAAISVGPDGAMTIGHSPLLRIISTYLISSLELPLRTDLESLIPPIIGGIARYGVPKRHDLLVRDASCAGANRLANTLQYQVKESNSPALELSRDADILDVSRLIEQSQTSLKTSISKGEIRRDRRSSQIETALENAKTQLERMELEMAQENLAQVCAAFR